MQTSAGPVADHGELATNIAHFGRVLRAAGLPVGPGRIIDALRAVETVGLDQRQDFYWALHAVFVNRQDQRELFDQAFHVFWRNPRLLEQLLSLVLPHVGVDQDGQDEKPKIRRRVAEALHRGGDGPAPRDISIHNAALTWSDREVLQRMDFEQMSQAELAEAKRAIADKRLELMQMPTRRIRVDRLGRRIDTRASLRASLRGGGAAISLRRNRRRRRPPVLVALCDISGSMSAYSRMLLHFLHALTNDRDRVHSFLFGTRLTNVTRHLRHRDIDVALERVADAVVDWSGGTRIGHCLHVFNRDWSRRVLGQGAIVLLISDGLDRDAAAGLEAEMVRLHKSCRRLIWLNPLLRYAAYEAKTQGARAMRPHVDEVRSVHNLESMAQLVGALGRPGGGRLGLSPVSA